MSILKLKKFLLTHKKTVFAASFITFIFLIIGFFHGFNMFHYPYFEDDEGTYISQAYAFGYLGKLSNYTFWYDHSPVGWIITSFWLRLTGGLFTFGYSLNSGRMFMLFVHLVSSGCIFLIARKYVKNNWAPAIAIIAFSLSPLGVYFQRRLLLDNIMVCLVLLSLLTIVFSKQRLQWIIVSAFLLGLAILSKENALIVLPGFLLVLYLTLDKKQRLMGLVLFTTLVLLCISFYVMLALFKGELLPGSNHVSLLGSIQYQLTRGNKLPFWNPKSDFFGNFIEWLRRDSGYMIATIAATFWMTFSKNKAKQLRAIGVVTLLFWLYLIKGGTVINFYVIPVLALGSLALAILIYDIGKIKYVGIPIVIAVFSIWLLRNDFSYLKIDETSPQVNAVNWVKANIPSSAVLSVDDAQLVDIKYSRNVNDPAFPKAEWFTKLADDPQVQKSIHNDWRNINYLVVSHEFIRQLHEKNIPFLDPTLKHATEIASFGPVSKNTYLNIDQRISTNGDWIKVYKVEDKTTILLSDAWKSFLANYVTPDGQVVDPAKATTTSDDQAKVMLQAVMIGDKSKFDLIWNWTHWHLQFRQDDRLFSSVWQGKGKSGKIIDSSSNTGADTQIATALILAGKKWNNQSYISSAKEIVSDIWQKQVVALGDGNYYVLAGSWAGYGDVVTVNPSYLYPGSYRMFAAVDPSHDWNILTEDSYRFLNNIFTYSTVGLPPNWVGVIKTNGSLVYPPDQTLPIDFNLDAMRVYYNVAEDVLWFKSQEGYDYLKKSSYIVNYYTTNKIIPDDFSFLGSPNTTKDSDAAYGALLPYVLLENTNDYQVLSTKLQNIYMHGQWGSGKNYYTASWVWLGFALANNVFTPPTDYSKNISMVQKQ